MVAQFIGVGVGPGDPELITLKAARLIQQADVISFIANADGESQACQIAIDVLQDVKPGQERIPVMMPMFEDRTPANQAYDAAAKAIKSAINAGKKVVFLCEGDPLFFGSFAYLLERLRGDVTTEVVPGISSVHAASSALQLPLTMLKESFAVVSGRHDSDYLIQTLKTHDSVVIMKAGRSREKILSALREADRIDEANYLEYIGREAQLIETDVDSLQGEAGPYFSLFVVIKSDRDRT
ncbi:MAG: precorrin-2 C(20)-methyltransferase [Pseudomonadales bacterium]|nr:precorrin-2 C(20)-methyltransferase [Pseudomonadales bacterium]